MRYRILTLNNISPRGLERLPAEGYEIGADIEAPHAILVRSADMHQFKVPASVLGVGRAQGVAPVVEEERGLLVDAALEEDRVALVRGVVLEGGAEGAVTALLGHHVLRSSTAGPAAVVLASDVLGRWSANRP